MRTPLHRPTIVDLRIGSLLSLRAASWKSDQQNQGGRGGVDGVQPLQCLRIGSPILVVRGTLFVADQREETDYESLPPGRHEGFSFSFPFSVSLVDSQFAPRNGDRNLHLGEEVSEPRTLEMGWFSNSKAY